MATFGWNDWCFGPTRCRQAPCLSKASWVWSKSTVCFFICGCSEKGVVCITWLICLAHLFTYLVRVQNSFRNIFYSKGWRKINKKEDFSCGRSFFKTYFKFCLISMLVPSDLMYGQKAVFNHFDQKMAKFGQNTDQIWSLS